MKNKTPFKCGDRVKATDFIFISNAPKITGGHTGTIVFTFPYKNHLVLFDGYKQAKEVNPSWLSKIK